MTERIVDLDQLREQRERLVVSTEEAEREASDRCQTAKRSQAKLQDLKRGISRAELAQAEKPDGRWARLRFGVRSQLELRRQIREFETENERLRGYESKVKAAGSIAGRVMAGSEVREASRA